MGQGNERLEGIQTFRQKNHNVVVCSVRSNCSKYPAYHNSRC